MSLDRHGSKLHLGFAYNYKVVMVPVAVKWSRIVPLAFIFLHLLFPAEYLHQIFSDALCCFVFCQMTILLSALITHLRSVPTQTIVLQIISLYLFSKTVLFSTMYFWFILHCYYSCRVVSSCRAQTEKSSTTVSSFYFIWKLPTCLNFISFS